jgi:hypothetical protein
MTLEVFLLLALLGIKHFLADFVFQFPYMVQEKGTYGALGGVHHAAFHASLTFFVLLIVASSSAWVIPLAAADGLIHYHIDWIKQQLNRGLTVKDDMWWVWFGADQAAHYLTYVGIIYVITS